MWNIVELNVAKMLFAVILLFLLLLRKADLLNFS